MVLVAERTAQHP
jgi:ribonuclease HI